MAIGAYTTAILNVNYGVGLYWTIPIAGILTGLFGFAFGFPALRLSGVYLALATFGLAVSVPLVAKRFEGSPAAARGRRSPSPPRRSAA
jgi:branched-chain amino acid transport system permease protein